MAVELIGDASVSSAPATIEDLPPDVLTSVFRRLDGVSLAAASCAAASLRSLSTQQDLWRDLCLSTWPSLRHPILLHLIPSFPDSHRSFFADAYPSPAEGKPVHGPIPSKLISAVDLHHGGSHIMSIVVETDASSAWFLGSPFRIDCDPASTAEIASPEDLVLSWTVIDPTARRAANVSSRRAVAVERHWYTGETLVRFATVAAGDCAVAAVVTCAEETGHVREVSLTVEDADGMCINGRESLVILNGAMEGGRRMAAAEEHVRRYEGHVMQRVLRKERKIQREGMLDLCCSAVGVAVFLAFLVLVAFR